MQRLSVCLSVMPCKPIRHKHSGMCSGAVQVGGLRDTVKQYNPYENSGTGWTFDRAEGNALRGAVSNAINTYRWGLFPVSWRSPAWPCLPSTTGADVRHAGDGVSLFAFLAAHGSASQATPDQSTAFAWIDPRDWQAVAELSVNAG
jgi:hypothetical protein